MKLDVSTKEVMMTFSGLVVGSVVSSLLLIVLYLVGTTLGLGELGAVFLVLVGFVGLNIFMAKK